MSQRTGCLGGGLFALYAGFVLLAYMIASVDHGTSSSTSLYKGLFSGIALFLAGLPWSYMLVDGAMGLSENTANTLLYLFPILNLAAAGWMTFGSRSKPTDHAE